MLSKQTKTGGSSLLSAFHLLEEHEFPTANYDKVFASVWLSPTLVIMGTKCNKLLVLDIETSKQTEIPAIMFSDPDLNHNPTATSKQLCYGIHSLAINPSRSLLAVGSGRPTEFIQIYCLPSFEPLAVLRGDTDMVFSVEWISDHQLISCSRDTTVKCWSIDFAHTTSTTTLPNGSKIAVLKPASCSSQHRGKVRDLKYNPNTGQALSISSDGFAKLWNVQNCSLASSVLLKEPNEAVCLAADFTNNLFAVGSQSHISLIDPRSNSIVKIFESLDEGWGVRSMSMDSNIITIGGGMGRLSFYDMRAHEYISWTPIQRSPKARISSLLSTNNPLQTLAVNNIIPFNIRPYSRILSVRANDNITSPARFLKNGKGWLSRDADYEAYFQGTEINNAIYTLSYYRNSNGYGAAASASPAYCARGGLYHMRRRHRDRYYDDRQAASSFAVSALDPLFVAGGPLQLSICGSYAAIWGL